MDFRPLIAHITDTITAHFDELDEPCTLVSIGDWLTWIDEPRCRFGWSIEQIGVFCPERLAVQLADFDADVRDHYLLTMLYLCDRHIVLETEAPGLTAEERQRRLESELYDEGPGTLLVLTTVEMAALDLLVG